MQRSSTRSQRPAFLTTRQDEVYYEEYKAVYQEKIGSRLPILYNVNFGHAYPRTVLAIGQQAVVDPQKQEIRYLEPVVKGI